MLFELNKENGIPLYIQIESRITNLIRNGVLKQDEKLPATRELAQQLSVHRNTVVQAYQELEVKGLVYSEVGSGTFVSKFVQKHFHDSVLDGLAQKQPISFEGLYASSWTNIEDMTLTSIENAIRQCAHPQDAISFSSVVPDKSLFPLREFQNCTYHAIQKYGVDLLEMGDTQGFRPFLEYLPKFLVRRGLSVRWHDLLVVSGIQQGIDLISRIFLNPGDTVVTEEMTYRGALRIFHALGVNVIGIPMDHNGMRMDILETVLNRHKIKLIYTIPTFQNPTGTIMPIDRRRTLLDLAYRHKTPIIEDQYANELRFDGEEVLPLSALDDKGLVIVLGSFSKILFHGIRLGWIIAPSKEVLSKLVYAKKITDWQNNPLIQGAILEFCERGFFDKYLKRKLKILKERREAMFRASQEYFSEDIAFNHPSGGLFEWVELPKQANAYEILMETRKRGVLFTPKRFFAVNSELDNGMRLGFVSLTPERIDEGIRILSEAIRKNTSVLRNPATAETVFEPVI
jgi:DNA-binding transcriptional MocR family regulator